MTPNDILLAVGDYIVLSALIPLALFVIYYLLRSPFTLTEEGKNVLFQKIATIVLLLVIVLSLFLGEYPGRWAVRVVSFSALVYFYWVDFAQLRSIQKKYPYRRRHK